MIYTNKYNIPDRVFKWLIADDYDHEPGVISATTIIGPARAWALKRKFENELTQDCSAMFRMRGGTALHDSMERAGVFGDDDFREQRFYADLMGFRISGKMDLVENGVICDTKSTSVWKAVNQDYDDYIKQLSIYKWLLHMNGFETADYGLIDLFFNDWKKADALKGGNYPPIPYQEQRIELWSLQQTEKYIGDRLVDFAFAESVLPECTPEELWQTPSTWAVYAKAGNVRAAKVCHSEAEANEYVASKGGVVEPRPGKVKRCGYCTAAPFCEQFNRMKSEGLIDD